MLKALVRLPITVKHVLTNIPNDFTWYTTMMKVGISIVKESQDLKCHSIRCKFANTECEEKFSVLVKKNQQPTCPKCLS